MNKITMTFYAEFKTSTKFNKGLDDINPHLMLMFWARDSLAYASHEILGPEGEVIGEMKVIDIAKAEVEDVD